MKKVKQYIEHLNSSENIVDEYLKLNHVHTKTILKLNFDNTIVFNLPVGNPLMKLKYVNNELTEVLHKPLLGEEISINVMMRNLHRFIQNPSITYTKKELIKLESIYIKILMELSIDDANIISLMKDKRLHEVYTNLVKLQDVCCKV